MDSGLIGFYTIAKKVIDEEFDKVEFSQRENSLFIHGEKEVVEEFLHKCMHMVLEKYYNISTKKQIEEKAGFYYDTKAEKFERFSKVKTQGIANIIFSKAPRPTQRSAKYNKKDGLITDPEFSYLSDHLQKFLEENKLKLEAANLLIDGKNMVQPKYEIELKEKSNSDSCFICGTQDKKLLQLKGTAFPLITGDSGVKSFFSNGGKAEKVCWQCDYISRFVPVHGYYKTLHGGGLLTFFPISNSLDKLMSMIKNLKGAEHKDDNYYRNYEDLLGGYYQKGYESSFSFFYTLYYKMLNIKEEEKAEDLDDSLLDNNFKNNLKTYISNDSVYFHIFEVVKLGDSYIGKMNWPYNDTIYIFRLLEQLNIIKKCNIRKAMYQIVDWENSKNDNKTIVRNRVCERILKKAKIMDIVEPFLFTMNKSKRHYFNDLFKFVMEYENLIDGGNSVMDANARQLAVKLGHVIGHAITNETRGSGKGDLFKLRKTRTIPDFLEEVNRLQFRYGLSLSKEIYDGVITVSNFKEFKQYVMISALNTFNYRSSKNEKSGGQE